MWELFHQPFDYVTAKHVIKGRAPRSADHYRIDIEGLGRIGNRLGRIVRHSPNRYDFYTTLAHGFQGGLQGLHSLLVGPVRRIAGEETGPLLDKDTVQRRLASSFGTPDRFLNQAWV